MEVRELLMNVISIGVLLSLLGTLMFATGAMKAKKDPEAKKRHGNRAWLFLGLYVVLNVLRLLMERGIL